MGLKMLRLNDLLGSCCVLQSSGRKARLVSGEVSQRKSLFMLHTEDDYQSSRSPTDNMETC